MRHFIHSKEENMCWQQVLILMNLSNSWTHQLFPRAQDAVFVTDVVFGALVTGRNCGKLMS